MSYIINGPVILGDTSKNTTINGNVFTPDLTTGTGDLIYCSNGATGALTRLGFTTNGHVLTLVGGLPSWTAGGGGINKTPIISSTWVSTPLVPAVGLKYRPITLYDSDTTGIYDYEVAVVPRSGIFNNLYIVRSAAEVTITTTIKLYKNAVATTLSVSLPAAATTGSDLVNSVSVVAGDTVAYGYSGSGAGNSRYYSMSMVFTPS